jgi:hypothetical protein
MNLQVWYKTFNRSLFLLGDERRLSQSPCPFCWLACKEMALVTAAFYNPSRTSHLESLRGASVSF